MIYDKHAYKIVVVISSYIDEFFIWQIYLALYLSFNGGNNFNPIEFQRNEAFQNATASFFSEFYNVILSQLAHFVASQKTSISSTPLPGTQISTSHQLLGEKS
jgi:hypothetical protein